MLCGGLAEITNVLLVILLTHGIIKSILSDSLKKNN